MANVGKIRKGVGERTTSRNRSLQEIVPSSAWTEDRNGHYLLVDLPDFKREQVRLQVDDSGTIMVSGERPEHEDKYIYFEQTYLLPENSDADKITGKFDGEILYVTVPKLVVEEEPDEKFEDASGGDHHHHHHHHHHHQQQQQHHHSTDENNEEKCKERSSVDGFHREVLRERGQVPTPLGSAMEMIWKHKGVLFTVALAFSVGVVVSRYFESSAGN